VFQSCRNVLHPVLLYLNTEHRDTILYIFPCKYIHVCIRVCVCVYPVIPVSVCLSPVSHGLVRVCVRVGMWMFHVILIELLVHVSHRFDLSLYDAQNDFQSSEFAPFSEWCLSVSTSFQLPPTLNFSVSVCVDGMDVDLITNPLRYFSWGAPCRSSLRILVGHLDFV